MCQPSLPISSILASPCISPLGVSIKTHKYNLPMIGVYLPKANFNGSPSLNRLR